MNLDELQSLSDFKDRTISVTGEIDSFMTKTQKKNNLMRVHQVIYTGCPDGIRTRDM